MLQTHLRPCRERFAGRPLDNDRFSIDGIPAQEGFDPTSLLQESDNAKPAADQSLSACTWHAGRELRRLRRAGFDEIETVPRSSHPTTLDVWGCFSTCAGEGGGPIRP